MYLERAKLVRLGPFEALDIDFCDADGAPRALTLVHGEGGTGKSTLLGAVAATRPGHHVVQTQRHRRPGGTSFAACDWQISAEDHDRPHALRVATPGVKVEADDAAEQLRRKEVAHFDRRTSEGGFALVWLPAHRQFPTASLTSADPARSMVRHDLRGPPGASDGTQMQLTRACKQILAYAGLSAALAGHEKGEMGDPRVFGSALHEALDLVLDLIGYRYLGLSPKTLEPRFEGAGGEVVPFDGLSTAARHLVSFVALPFHQARVAHRGQDPREGEVVVLIDDVDLHLGELLQSQLCAALRKALPRAQWIVATHSSTLAAAVEIDALVSLRRMPHSNLVEIHHGELARTH